MTDYLEAFMAGQTKEYVPKTTQINLGVDDLPEITAPAEDRNRTSPFPYGGYRFEFRACGSSQNVSLVNTVLTAMMANEFDEIAARVEAGQSAATVAQEMLKAHFKCVYNGNGYDPAWPEEAVKKGVCRIDSGVDAISKLTDTKNIDLFVKTGVFTAAECHARRTVLLELYIGVVEMECLVMIDMINQHVLPSCAAANLDASTIKSGLIKLESGLKAVHAAEDEIKSATIARTLRLETMTEVRAACDEAEAKCPASLWTLATYKDLLFIDTEPRSKL